MPLFGQVPAEDSRNVNLPHTDTHFTMPVYRSLAEWEARKARLRRQILAAAGLLPMPEKSPLRPRIFGRLDRGDHTIEKVLLETSPGYYLGGNLYRPAKRSGKLPAVLAPHGHWFYGRLEHQPLNSTPALGISLARQGYVVFAYDMLGYNDTVQTPHSFGGPREQLWSFGALGLQLWNSIRAVDFVQSLADVDPERIAATGASGGGTQTFLLTAVDGRVKASAPVNMVSFAMQGGDPCENAPNLRLDATNVEIAAMMAPRPMLLVSASGDWTRDTPREEFPAVRRIYELYGQAENVETVQIDAPHNYNQASREAVYQFFARRVLALEDAGAIAEQEILPPGLDAMLVLHGRNLPANALSLPQLFAEWRRAAQLRRGAVRDRGEMRTRLLDALRVEWPAQVAEEIRGQAVTFGRDQKGDRVTGLWFPGAGTPALVVHPDGAAAARRSPAAQSLLRQQRPVLLIDAFQTGGAKAPRDRAQRYFLTFNQSDDANRVQDILTAMAFLLSKTAGRIELVGVGGAGVWCRFAAAVAPVETTLAADLEGFRGTDEDFLGRFNVPGIQAAGGWNAALSLTAPRR